MSGVLVPEQGYGVILVDGSLIAQVRVPHQSIIVADDATLGEGVRMACGSLAASGPASYSFGVPNSPAHSWLLAANTKHIRSCTI